VPNGNVVCQSSSLLLMQTRFSSFNFKQNFFNRLITIGNLHSTLALTLIVALIAMTIPAWTVAVPTAEAAEPDQPQDLATTSVLQTSVDVQWTDPSDSTITGYQSSKDNSAWTDVAGSDANTTTHTFDGLTANTDYTLYIRAIGTGGTSTAASIDVTTAQISAPNAPTGLATTTQRHSPRP